MNRVRLPWFRREMSAGRFALVMNLPTLLCLGLVLVAIGWLYQRILFRRRPTSPPAVPAQPSGSAN